MWRCVGESCAHCLTEGNEKGMELGASGREVSEDRSVPLILSSSSLHRLTRKCFCFGEVMFSGLCPRETAKHGRTGCSGRRRVVKFKGVRGCLKSSLKHLVAERRQQWCAPTLHYTVWICKGCVVCACVCRYPCLGYQLRLVTGQPKKFGYTSLPCTLLNRTPSAEGLNKC